MVQKNILCLVFLMLLTLTACQNTPTEPIPSGQLMHHSECLQTAAGFLGDFAPVIEECLSYKISSGVVVLRHEGAIFNCMPGEIGGHVTINEDLIEIHERQSQSGAHCLCPFNLEYEIKNLSRPRYRVNLYTEDNRCLSLIVENRPNSTGKECQPSPLYR